ncbi:hypothetical protein [Nakamurella panacisegetis]|nr:hypothetical protein [Nakamurella panacisegetis]
MTYAVHLRAVQQVPSVFDVDLPVFDDRPVCSGEFRGSVFILDEQGIQQAVAPWPVPTDEEADVTLQRLGLERLTTWEHDEFGRRTAHVTPIRTGADRSDRWPPQQLQTIG